MAIKKEPQTHMEEKSIENPQLLEQLTEMTESEEEAKRYRKAKKTAIELVKGLDFAPGWYRIGEFRIEIKEISGGGFEIGKWESKTVKITGPEGFTG